MSSYEEQFIQKKFVLWEINNIFIRFFLNFNAMTISYYIALNIYP